MLSTDENKSWRRNKFLKLVLALQYGLYQTMGYWAMIHSHYCCFKKIFRVLARVVKFLKNLSSTLPWKIKDFWGSALKKPWFFQPFNPWICSINLENLALILGLKFKFFQVFTLKKTWISRFALETFSKNENIQPLIFPATPWKCLSNPCLEI